MATINFKLPEEAFVNFTRFVEELKFTYICTDLYQKEVDVGRKCTFRMNQEYLHDNGHYFCYPEFIEYEPLAVEHTINQHMGPVYYVSTVFGGPFLELLFYIKGKDRIFEGDLTMKPMFTLKDYSEIKPDDKLKAAFNDIRNYIRRETRALAKKQKTSGG